MYAFATLRIRVRYSTFQLDTPILNGGCGIGGRSDRASQLRTFRKLYPWMQPLTLTALVEDSALMDVGTLRVISTPSISAKKGGLSLLLWRPPLFAVLVVRQHRHEQIELQFDVASRFVL
jgi:hypothetical protein